MKIIFLDMDGVINPMGDFYDEPRDDIRRVHPDKAKLLNEITDKTGAVLVISSAWRVGRTLEELQAEFACKGITGQVIDKTRASVHGECRGRDIAAWLANWNFIEKFVILDDDNDMAELIEHLVQTDSKTGLTNKEVKKIISMLA